MFRNTSVSIKTLITCLIGEPSGRYKLSKWLPDEEGERVYDQILNVVGRSSIQIKVSGRCVVSCIESRRCLGTYPWKTREKTDVKYHKTKIPKSQRLINWLRFCTIRNTVISSLKEETSIYKCKKYYKNEESSSVPSNSKEKY